MRSKVIRTISVITLLAVFALSSLLPLTLVRADNQINWNSLQIGEVVSHGTPVANGNTKMCVFSNAPTFVVEVNQGSSKSMDLKQDSQCNLYVASLSSSAAAAQSSSSKDPTNNYVYNHDPVGLVLTSAKGTATVSTCGSNICISSYVESCYAFPDGWVTTACVIDSTHSPGNPATGAGHGSSHWLMGSYVHTLYNSEKIYNQAGSIVLDCFWSYSGSIVQGMGAGLGEQCYFS